MGEYTNFRLNGWGSGDRFLSASEKEEIQDFLFDEEVGMYNYGQSHDNSDPWIMDFGGQSYFTYQDVEDAISNYAKRNPDIILELEYDCEDDDEHLRIRFKGDDLEVRNRVEAFFPFSRLTTPDDRRELPALRFHFAPSNGEKDSSVLVLLDSALTDTQTDELEDSIASYIESVPEYDPHQLVRDVLTSANVTYCTVSPKHTFDI